jgi:hypothetical protein
VDPQIGIYLMNIDHDRLRREFTVARVAKGL